MLLTTPLCRALSKLGYFSRSEATVAIANGEISVNGKIIKDPDCVVSLDTCIIKHNGILLEHQELCFIMLYKPKGIITSRKDEQGRPTVYSLLPSHYQHLHCVGRLDWATSGLLLLTNNTMVSSWLTDPSNGVPRIYIVTVRGLVTPEKAETMMNGITDRDQTLKSDSVVIRKASKRESHLVITLSEGKNREVRRLCSSIGNEVTKLKRVAYGPLTLGNLSPGEHRILPQSELESAFPQLSQLFQL